MRLERDLVFDRLACEARLLLPKDLRARPTPAAAVELVQHRPAPVPLLRCRRCTAEAHAERHVARRAQVRDVAQRHFVVEPGAGLRAGVDAPERAGQPWEQQEQRERDRHGLQQQHECAPRKVHGRRRSRIGVHPHERDGRQERAAEQPGQLQQSLVAQQRRVEQEPGDEDQDREVAGAAGLEQLGRRHQHQERRTGLDAVERAVGAEDRDGGHDDDHDAQPARGERPAAMRSDPAPGAHREQQHSDPGGQGARVRCHGNGERTEHPGEPVRRCGAARRGGSTRAQPGERLRLNHGPHPPARTAPVR